MFELVSKLEKAYTNIFHTKMADVPICNEYLQVETIGFCEWEGYLTGILITPWMMNLVILSNEKTAPALALDKKQIWHFPSGQYEFMGINIDEVGDIQTCSLISPMNEFNNQSQAVDVANKIIEQIFLADEKEQVSISRRRLFGLNVQDED